MRTKLYGNMYILYAPVSNLHHHTWLWVLNWGQVQTRREVLCSYVKDTHLRLWDNLLSLSIFPVVLCNLFWAKKEDRSQKEKSNFSSVKKLQNSTVVICMNVSQKEVEYLTSVILKCVELALNSIKSAWKVLIWEKSWHEEWHGWIMNSTSI